jgi:hypothetical protein
MAAVMKAAGFDVEAPTRDAELRARLAAVHAFKKGQVFSFADASTRPVAEYESADKLWEAFEAGACWTGEAPKPAAKAGSILTARAEPGVLPPLACKLYQESKLFSRSA